METATKKSLFILSLVCNPRLTTEQRALATEHIENGEFYGVARPVKCIKGIYMPYVNKKGAKCAQCIDSSGRYVDASYERISRETLFRMYRRELKSHGLEA